MDEIYVNTVCGNPHSPMPSTIKCTAPRKRNFYLDIIVFFCLLSVFLLAGLIALGVHLHNSAADLSATSSKLSSMTGERDFLRANLTEKTTELERLQSLSKQKKTCPAGWTMFRCSCYLVSESSGSWDAGRTDCRNKGADLVVIDSPEVQTFLSTITQGSTWIGLNDIEQEGQWKWVDGTPLTLSYWATNEPNNAGAPLIKEDCVHIRAEGRMTWNDLPCTSPLKWICEKIP